MKKIPKTAGRGIRMLITLTEVPLTEQARINSMTVTYGGKVLGRRTGPPWNLEVECKRLVGSWLEAQKKDEPVVFVV